MYITMHILLPPLLKKLQDHVLKIRGIEVYDPRRNEHDECRNYGSSAKTCKVDLETSVLEMLTNRDFK